MQPKCASTEKCLNKLYNNHTMEYNTNDKNNIYIVYGKKQATRKICSVEFSFLKSNWTTYYRLHIYIYC